MLDDLIGSAAVAAAYLIAAWVGILCFPSFGGMVLMWPPAGVAVVALATFGLRLWPGVLTGSFLFGWMYADLPPSLGLGLAAADCVQIVMAAFGLRFLGVAPGLRRTRDAVGLIAVAASAPAVGSALSTAAQEVMGGLTVPELWRFARHWWMGNALGMLVVGGLLLAWQHKRPYNARIVRDCLALGLLIALISFGLYHRRDFFGSSGVPRFLYFPALIVAALRVGPAVATTLCAVVAVLIGSRAVLHETAAADQWAVFDFGFLFFATAVTMLVASVDADRSHALAESRTDFAKLRAILQSGSDGTWEWAPPTGEFHWSVEFYGILGYPPSDSPVDFAFVRDLVHTDDRQRFDDSLVGHLDNQQPYDVELRFRRADGTYGHYRCTGQSLYTEEGERFRVVGSIHDLTERVHAERDRLLFERNLLETQRLESLAVLAGGIAHDFNNLLTAILGNANLARMDLPTTSPAQNNLEAIERASVRAAELCQQMLAYAGKTRLSSKPIDLSDFVREAGQLLLVSFGQNVGITFELADDLPPVWGDATQLRQILMDLAINAAEAIGAAPGRMIVRTGLAESGNRSAGPFAFLEVSDDGCGMDDETVAKIFDPFFTTKFVGRGLGLAASLGLVRQHGGSIEVHSRPGEGSRFRVLLPTRRADVAVASPAPVRAKQGAILVAGGEPLIRMLAARILGSAGFEVVVATNLSEAVAALKADPSRYRAVLLDVSRNESVAVAVGEVRQAAPGVPLVLLAGYLGTEDRQRLGDHYLRKPFTAAELTDVIRRAVAN